MSWHSKQSFWWAFVCLICTLQVFIIVMTLFIRLFVVTVTTGSFCLLDLIFPFCRTMKFTNSQTLCLIKLLFPLDVFESIKHLP